MTADLLLALAFFTVAFVYASVGFGGGSGYLALLSLAGLPFPELRLTALICNIIVVGSNSVLFSQHRQINFSKIWPLIAGSIPLAFAGASIRLHERTFFLLLGFSLIAASITLWFQPENKASDSEIAGKNTPVRDAGIGASIGLLSGMVGIGGGIFLAPVLHFLRWDSARKIAACASIFILANALAGIAGQLFSNHADLNYSRILMLGISVLAGGQAGLRISFKKYSMSSIRKVTALLVLAAGLEAIIKH